VSEQASALAEPVETLTAAPTRKDLDPGYVPDTALIAAYAPRPDGSATAIDYALIDEALDTIVFNSGPSLRTAARRPDAALGKRIVTGHTSRLRLEGNKVFYSLFDHETKAAITDYRQSLEAIGASGRVQRLSKNEQLAYWFNLHNLVVMDEIAKDYPVKAPSKIRVGPNGETLHLAKIIDLGERKLSLRDVREVVYRNWADPDAIYGFYRGDLGSPSIQSRAFRGNTVSDDLERIGREFVNSLRGVSAASGGAVAVSPIYEEAQAVLFPNWPRDLRAHLMGHADAEVAALLDERPEVAFANYEDDVGDMVGGDIYSDLYARGGVQRASLPPGMGRIVQEYEEKILELKRRGFFRSKVIIVDVPTDDE
jgi:hypothetical protein